MGSAAASHLARRGRRVLGLDRYSPPHGRGASHGGSRVIRCAYFEGPGYVPLVLCAWEGWERLEAETGERLLTLTGALMLGPPDCPVVEGSRRSASHFDLPHELLDAGAVRRRWPVLSPPPGHVALYEERAGLVPPEAAVAAHLRVAAGHGAELHTGEPVLRWKAAPGQGVRVETPRAVYDAGSLVLSAGPWAPEVLGDLGLPLTVERVVQFWFPPAGGPHPVFVWDDGGGELSYGIPPHGGRGLKLGTHYGGVPCTAESADRTVRPEDVEAVRRRLVRILPWLRGVPIDASVCLYTNTPDHHFVIGRHPGHPQVVLAAGFSGHGFKFAPVVGEILADIATSGATSHPIELFDPERFTRGPAR
jgi:sarcosine oxidase